MNLESNCLPQGFPTESNRPDGAAILFFPEKTGFLWLDDLQNLKVPVC